MTRPDASGDDSSPSPPSLSPAVETDPATAHRLPDVIAESSRVIHQNPWMTVREDQTRRATGESGTYGVVEKPDFALVVPWDSERFHLIEQFRYPHLTVHSWPGADALPAVERWPVAGRRSLYASSWVSVDLVAVEPPGAPAYEYHVVNVSYDAVVVVVHHADHGVLLLFRHRFITTPPGWRSRPAVSSPARHRYRPHAARSSRKPAGSSTTPD